MEEELKIVDLDALVRPIGRIRLFAETYDVLPINGTAADLLYQVSQQQANGGGSGLQYVEVAREIVSSSIPQVSRENLRKMSLEQLTAVIGIATKQAERVQDMIESFEGNVTGPVRGPKGQTTRGTPARKSSSQSAPQ